MRNVDWSEYGIELKKRPSPYDFPAFEHEKGIGEHRPTAQENSLDVKKSGKVVTVIWIMLF